MAHGFTNTGFETAGATAGYAAGWTFVFVSTAEQWAGYDSTTPEPVEDFEEEWGDNEDGAYELGTTATASYDTTPAEPREDFEEEWSNEPHTWELASTATASYDTTPEAYENFEENWDDNEEGQAQARTSGLAHLEGLARARHPQALGQRAPRDAGGPRVAPPGAREHGGEEAGEGLRGQPR